MRKTTAKKGTARARGKKPAMGAAHKTGARDAASQKRAVPADKEGPPEAAARPARPEMQKPCCEPVEPAWWALPPWEDANVLRKEAQENGLTFHSFFSHECGDFDEAQRLVSANYKQSPMAEDKSMRLMLDSNSAIFNGIRPENLKAYVPDALPPSRMRYAVVLVKDRKGMAIGAMDGFLLSSGGRNSVILMHGAASGNGVKRRYVHQLAYCALVAAMFRSPEKAPLDHVMLACGYPRLDDAGKSMETLGRLLFLGRGLGLSALPMIRGRFPWGLCMPFMMCARAVGKEDEPATAGEAMRMAGLFFAVLGLSGIVGAGRAKEELTLALEELAKRPKDDALPLITLPRSPDLREQVHELSDAVGAVGILEADCAKYKDDPYCLEYMAYVSKLKASGKMMLGLPEAVELLKQEHAIKRVDVTPPSL